MNAFASAIGGRIRVCLLASILVLAPACSDSDSSGATTVPYAETVIGANGAVNGNYFCRPESDGNVQLLIHLMGSFVEATSESSTAFALHACTHGFAALVPDYNNATPPGLACGEDDACHDAFHREILFGEEVAPDPISVNTGESIVERISALLNKLAADDPDYNWEELASRFATQELQTFTVSGHSQGNGHALYWAREEEFRRVVLFGGVADRLGPTDSDSDRVTWLKDMAISSATPLERIRSFLHVDEDGLTGVVGSRANLATIGAESDCDYFNLEEACKGIEIPGMQCLNPLSAHEVVISESFGENCEAGGANSNEEIWDLLLLGR